jgi:hypothetical protein
VIDHGGDWNLAGKLSDSAGVVLVIMRQQDKVDFADPSILRRPRNAIGVSIIVAGPTSIDKERLVRRSDKQSRLSTLDVDQVDLQRIGLRPCGCRQGERETNGRN